MLPYLELKLARELFGQLPETLDDAGRRKVRATAQRQLEIERRVLQSALAATVGVPNAAVEARVAEIRGRYADAAEFDADLTRLTLRREEFKAIVARELHVEAILERVAAEMPSVSDLDAEIFYHQHRSSFMKPELRALRHILITAEGPAGDDAAQKLLNELRQMAQSSAQAFARLAECHSQCPTALQGGQLGKLRAGQLYASLEPVAFALAAGEVSHPTRSPLGWHLLRCDAIEQAVEASFADVLPRIREHLSEKRRALAQKAWIKALFAETTS